MGVGLFSTLQAGALALRKWLLGSEQQVEFWTDNRREIARWLAREAPSLGGLYDGALRLLYAPTFPGRTRFVAHAVREIRNGLPAEIVGFKGPGRLDYTSRMDTFSNLWTVAKYPLDGSLPEMEALPKASTPPSMVAMPLELYQALAELVRDHADARERPYEAARRLFSKTVPPGAEVPPAPIAQWIKETKWCEKVVHDPRRPNAEMPIEELRAKFELFETMMVPLARPFFIVTDQIDAILEDANS